MGKRELQKVNFEFYLVGVLMVVVLSFSFAQLCLTFQPHGLQHTRLPRPSLSPTVCSNSYPLNQWCHSTLSSSISPFSSCLQSFPASGSFPMILLFTSAGHCIGASASVLPRNIHVVVWVQPIFKLFGVQCVNILVLFRTRFEGC